MATFGERLKEIRESHGYSQTELATLIECSPQLISYYETNRGVPRKDDIADSLCVALDTTKEWLYFGKGKKVASEEGTAQTAIDADEAKMVRIESERRVYTVNDVRNLDNVNLMIKHLQILPLDKDTIRSLHKTLSEFRTDLESKVLFGERRC